MAEPGERDEDQPRMPAHASLLLQQWTDVPEELLTPERRAARRAADSIRDLIARLADTSASLAQLEDLAERLDAAVAAMPIGATEGGPGAEPGAAEASLALPDELQRLIERSPIVGLANPLAAPLRMEVFDDHIVGHVRFSRAYEGPPGKVHGGHVAAVFDELLGSTQVLSGQAGMTGRLVINYRSPTPLETDLRMEGRIKVREGRKIFCEGTLHAGEQLCAEAEGLFVSIDPDRYRQMMEARGGAGAS
ncbi:MAG TPA: PaaI family thioesterase [Acidimicrobiales bacterium]